ncbi:MAG: tRNA 4-thiouridine(8) synthase ThiI [Firmicutes bacterium]|nr:tRNA 4-thiouridine(8) synthase ThiI [Bacillota bacterium]
MDRIILIKYGELSTKKGNRNFFINTLYNNVCNSLKKFDVKISKDRAHMYIEFNDSELDGIKSAIDKVFGIHKYHIAYIVNTNMEDIKSKVLEVAKSISFKTFKVETKRSFKGFEADSLEMSRILGGVILRNISDIKVDVHNPEVTFNVEIREDRSYIYLNSYNGSGGYPVGTQPRGMLMLSGGIDSPVAGYLAMKRGVVVDAVYFEAIPHTSLDARNKVISLARKLALYGGKINLHIVNFTPIQEEIYKNCAPSYCITIMRRMMYRIMEKIVKKYDGYIIINGESIGQVASQTLTSMNCINSVTNIPVIRPVSCLDKLEIIDIAKKIDTYETSILPYEDCCTVFVPKHPVINPSIEKSIVEEEKFNYSEMIDEAVNNLNTITVTSNDEEFSDLL